jgi:hypothetical protein
MPFAQIQSISLLAVFSDTFNSTFRLSIESFIELKYSKITFIGLRGGGGEQRCTGDSKNYTKNIHKSLHRY